MYRRWILAAVLLGWGIPLHADMPYPANPAPCTGEAGEGPCIEATDFARYLFIPTTEPPTLPNDFGNDNWKLTSATTGDLTFDTNPQELFGVKGASVDLAWQVTTGRPDVLIAVLDSGIRWGEAGEVADLVTKFFLNRGELPVPEGSTNTGDGYDRNGDGIFNLADYLADGTRAQDSRLRDENGNGVIDPEDLIFLFSDGSDGDQNGYVDDISGWDFFEDDNDALDEVRYGHGTGESEDSGAEANSGRGGAGSCPNCLLLPVRVGDSFITDVNLFAQGVVFAVDSGARVIQEALGTLNQSRFAQQAIDHAYRNGVVVVASAADEASNHHNYPANYNHTVQVNSVRRYEEFGPLRQMPASYLYLNGCTNYGGHIALSVPSSSCSSEATGLSSGMAGLLISAALNAIDLGTLTPYQRDDRSAAPFPLSAEEIKQLLTTTADDINFDARPDADPPRPQNYATSIPVPGVRNMERYHSIAGWDQYFGYGRINANRAVRAVMMGQIPPEAVIESPGWYDTIDPEAAEVMNVRGRVAANRATSYTYVVEVAPGIQPAEGDFTVEQTSAVRTEALEGELAEIDLGELRARMPNGVSGPATTDEGLPDPDRFSFTVRVRVMDDGGVRGEDRRVFALHHDPDLLPGFPLQLEADGSASPLTADIDGDGIEEIIVATSNGTVHAFRADGTEVAGWPVSTDPMELHLESAGYGSDGITVPVSAAILGSVVAGDVDRDGQLEVGATDMAGKAYLWNADGARRPGFPVSTLPEYSNSRRSERDLQTDAGRVPDRVNRKTTANRLGRALASGPVLSNLDGSPDGSLEIISGSFDRHLYAWHATGLPVMGWPVLLKDNDKVESVDAETNEVTLKPNANADIGTKIIAPPSVGDLDGDGDLEVVGVVNEEYREAANAIFTDQNINIFAAAGVIDMGNTRVYAVHADGVAHGGSALTRGWNPDAFLPGWPVRTALLTTGLLPTVGTGSNGPAALADVDGDGTLEIATFSAIGPAYVFSATGQSFLGQHPTGQAKTFATDTFGADSNSNDTPAFTSLGAPVLAEFAGDRGSFQLLAPTAGLGKFLDNQLPARQFPADNHLGVWDVWNDGPADGAFRDAFPRVVNDLQFFAAPAVADIDGDRLPEAISGTAVYDVHAFNINGEEATGWPKFTNGWMVGSPAVGDIDGDGLLEVVATTREGSLFAWRTTGPACGLIPWRRYHHDEWGTGNYHTDARPPASIRPSDVLAAEARSSSEARFSLARAPGDDLFCGSMGLPPRYDIRFAETAIANESAFANATGVRGQVIARSNQAGSIAVIDSRFAGRELFFAMIVTDEAANRSGLMSLGAVQFPEGVPPTMTAPPATVQPSVPPQPTQTRRPSTPSVNRETDDSCAVVPQREASGWGIVFLAGLLLVRMRVATRTRRSQPPR